MRMDMRYYKLDGHEVVHMPNDTMAWAREFEASWPARRVARTDCPGGVTVSTVFLGLDHNFCGDGHRSCLKPW